MGMNKSGSKVQEIVLGIALLATIGFLTWSFFQAITTLQKEVAIPIIVGSFTIIGSVLTIVISKHYERKREVERELRKQKIPVYEEFMENFFQVIARQQMGEPVSQEELVNFMRDFTRKIIVWGSEKFLNEFAKFRLEGTLEGERTPEDNIRIMMRFEGLMRAIREDLGHNNQDLEPASLLSLFITDISQYFPIGEEQ